MPAASPAPRISLQQALERARLARRQFAAVPRPRGPAPAPVVIVGAGPVGLVLALELTAHGIPALILERETSTSDGSRAICWSKRSLEILDRHGVAGSLHERGVTWDVGRVFLGADPVPLFSFDLLPVKSQKFPAFINLQQYVVEEALIDALARRPAAGIRWGHEVVGLRPKIDGIALDINTSQGSYTQEAQYVVAADGHRSPIRNLLGLDFIGKTFEDGFLIADVRMKAPFPAERRFYFDAPFNDGRTALLHQQPDDLWRLDFQLGRGLEREEALDAAHVDRRVKGLLGPQIDFEYEWVSLYHFQCRRMARFVHGRIIFAGDAAHLVSPFGARGANGGLQDADNLAWKLAAVLRGEADEALLAGFDEERQWAADENIAHSSRATDFMTPSAPGAQALQRAVLALARKHDFARALVNSGRLSMPCSLTRASAVTPDESDFATPGLAPGVVAVDAPIRGPGGEAWLLELCRATFVCLAVGVEPPAALPPGVRPLVAGRDFEDVAGLVSARYGGGTGALYLIRPDQHVVARWRAPDAAKLQAAWRRALALDP